MIDSSILITDDNDMYIYLKMIEQLQPQSVLDVGLFLQRIGAVSRQLMSCEIPADIYLDGIDLFGCTLPVYRRIYNQIQSFPSFDFAAEQVYDLAMLIHVNEWLRPEDRQFFWESLSSHARAILADADDPDFLSYAAENCRSEILTLDQKQYALVYGNVPGQSFYV
jgi:hypothetical protein